MSTLEYDLVRLTAQSAQQDPKHVQGGKPEYTRGDILACAAEMPHIAWHCLLSKYCGDEISEKEILLRMKLMSLQEWFTNPEHATKSIRAGQLNRVAELAVITYLHPKSQHAQSYGTRALFAGCGHKAWKNNFQSHYEWLVQELDYLEQLGKRAYLRRKFGPKDTDA